MTERKGRRAGTSFFWWRNLPGGGGLLAESYSLRRYGNAPKTNNFYAPTINYNSCCLVAWPFKKKKHWRVSSHLFELSALLVFVCLESQRETTLVLCRGIQCWHFKPKNKCLWYFLSPVLEARSRAGVNEFSTGWHNASRGPILWMRKLLKWIYILRSKAFKKTNRGRKYNDFSISLLYT